MQQLHLRLNLKLKKNTYSGKYQQQTTRLSIHLFDIHTRFLFQKLMTAAPNSRRGLKLYGSQGQRDATDINIFINAAFTLGLKTWPHCPIAMHHRGCEEHLNFLRLHVLTIKIYRIIHCYRFICFVSSFARRRNY